MASLSVIIQSVIIGLAVGALIATSIFYLPSSPVFAALMVIAIGVEAWQFHIYFSQRGNIKKLKTAIDFKNQSSYWNEKTKNDINDCCIWLQNDALGNELLNFFHTVPPDHNPDVLKSKLDCESLQLSCNIRLNVFCSIIGFFLGFLLFPFIVHFIYQITHNISIFWNHSSFYCSYK